MLQGICSHEDVRRRRRRRRRCSRYKFEFKWLFIDSWNIEFGLASVEHDERAHTQRAKSTFLNRTEHGGSSTESLKRDTAPHRTIFARFVQSNYCGEWKRFLSSSFDFNQLPPNQTDVARESCRSRGRNRLIVDADGRRWISVWPDDFCLRTYWIHTSFGFSSYQRRQARQQTQR